MPATKDTASRLTPFKLKPNRCMTANVGITDKGIATPAMMVARQSRRKMSTTSTAKRAPSMSDSIALWNESRVGCTQSVSLVNVSQGFFSRR